MTVLTIYNNQPPKLVVVQHPGPGAQGPPGELPIVRLEDKAEWEGGPQADGTLYVWPPPA